MTVLATDRAATARGLLWVVAGTVALSCAYWAEHVRGMAPCALCLWERWPYRLLILAGGVWVGLGLAGRRARFMWLPVLAILLAAAGLGVLHFGVERHWWPSPLPECAAPRFHGGSFAERLAAMPARPAKPCDAANTVFDWLPVSLVGMALIYATALLLLALVTGAGKADPAHPARQP